MSRVCNDATAMESRHPVSRSAEDVSNLRTLVHFQSVASGRSELAWFSASTMGRRLCRNRL